jgi:hypothetical protein
VNPAGLLFRGETLELADPLARFRYRCEGQRRMVEYAVAGVETHAHAPNSGGKTHVSMGLVTALCRGETQLGGVPLPGLKHGETWPHLLLVPTRKQQVEASQKALMKIIGDHPHHVGYASKQNDYFESVWIRPNWCTSGDWSRWSKVAIYCEESAEESVPGGRFRSANSDECPGRKVWGEVRARWMEGFKLLKWIAETPTKRSRYWWLFNDEAGFKGCHDRPVGGRVSINWALEDVHGPERVAELLHEYRGDPVIKARITGWPVNDEATCPFSGERLAEMLADCCEPFETWQVDLREWIKDDFDRREAARTAPVQVWVAPQEWHRGRIVVDPSAGIDDGRHDPNGFLLLDRVDPCIMARYNGYLDPASLGYLAGIVGQRWQRVCGEYPQIDVEMQNGWGGETIKSLRRMKYPNIGHRMVAESPGAAPRELYGFPNTDSERSRWISAIQIGLIDRSFKCYSREVVECLTDVVLDDNQKAVKSPGNHIEDMIELGYGLHQDGKPKPVRARIAEATDPLAASLRHDFGREIELPSAPGSAPEDDYGFGMMR